jgi:hypothetical protein
MVTSRFLSLLKSKQIGGSNAPTASELDNASNPVFLEPENLQDILQVGHVQQAIQRSRQNNGLPKGTLSEVTTLTVGDAPGTILQPSGEAVYQIVAIDATEGAGSDRAISIYVSDGSNGVLATAGTVTASSTVTLHSIKDPPFLISKGLYLTGLAAGDVTVKVAFHKLQTE